MDRQVLETFIVHHALPPAHIPQVLRLAGANPSPQETRQFVQRVLRLAGVLSLLAGVIFFIAANWEKLGPLGHFALVEAAFLLSIGLACWRPPPHITGRLALLAAFVLAGGLLALFGQTYQTGADVYELFLTWSLLALPFALLARWSAVSAAWLLVLNLALMLYSMGWDARGWGLLAGWGWRNPAQVVLVPMFVNLGLWLLTEYLPWPALRDAVPEWVRRMAVACSVAYATWAGAYAIITTRWASHHAGSMTAVWLGLGLALFSIAVLSLRRRRDVMPLTAVVGCGIILVCIGFSTQLSHSGLGLTFFIALWLIGSSTVAGRWLLHLHQEWQMNPVDREHAHG